MMPGSSALSLGEEKSRASGATALSGDLDPATASTLSVTLIAWPTCATALRQGERVAARREHLTLTTKGVRLQAPRSKVDAERKGA
jgi:hypothetical protein